MFMGERKAKRAGETAIGFPRADPEIKPLHRPADVKTVFG
jgi:hypothetical protein